MLLNSKLNPEGGMLSLLFSNNKFIMDNFFDENQIGMVLIFDFDLRDGIFHWKPFSFQFAPLVCQNNKLITFVNIKSISE
jgi:hypothetical protein